MSHEVVASIAVGTILLAGSALAQDDPQTVGVSVAGTVVEVPIELAAEACGIDADTLLAEWESLGTEVDTMSDTTVGADATDLAPDVAADTPMDAAIDGETVADGADATHEAGGEVAADIASDDGATTSPETAGTYTTMSDEVASTLDQAAAEPATPTVGTNLDKAAVCEITQETADQLGIATAG